MPSTTSRHKLDATKRNVRRTLNDAADTLSDALSLAEDADLTIDYDGPELAAVIAAIRNGVFIKGPDQLLSALRDAAETHGAPASNAGHLVTEITTERFLLIMESATTHNTWIGILTREPHFDDDEITVSDDGLARTDWTPIRWYDLQTGGSYPAATQYSARHTLPQR